MKVSLVVSQGVHAGKSIPISSPQFLIGRDPHCNLRPASPAISKQHCGIFVRDGKVFVVDYGSTNGTCVNDEPVTGEREVVNNDALKIGPLDFVLKIETVAARPTVKAAPAKTAVVSAASGTATAKSPPHPSGASEESAAEDADQAAAMLFAMDESGAHDPTAASSVPDGTTVMDIPAIPGGAPSQSQVDKTKKEQADTSKAAADLLSKYMRRPRAQ